MGIVLARCCWCFSSSYGSLSSESGVGGSDGNPISLVRFSNLKGPHCKASNFTISGVGTAYANVPLLQTRAYFDVTIIERGEFCVGVSRKSKEHLEKHLSDRSNCWYWTSGKDGGDLNIGDVIGCAYDLSEVKSSLIFYKNGQKIDSATISDIKGEVYPAVSVSGNCLLQVNFGGQTPFKYPPPPLFEPIIFSRDIL